MEAFSGLQVHSFWTHIALFFHFTKKSITDVKRNESGTFCFTGTVSEPEKSTSTDGMRASHATTCVCVCVCAWAAWLCKSILYTFLKKIKNKVNKIRNLLRFHSLFKYKYLQAANFIWGKSFCSTLCADSVHFKTFINRHWPTSGHAHVGPDLESWVNVDNCAPHRVTGEVSWYELHGGSQVVSGLVALLCAVICAIRNIYIYI